MLARVRFWPRSVLVWAAAVLGSLAVAVVAALSGVPGLPAPAAVALLIVLVTWGVAAVWRLLPAPVTAPRMPHSPSWDAVDAHLRRLVDDGDPPGIAIVVVHDGSTVLARGYGYADPGATVPVTPDTLFRWWSLTKVVTAVSMLALHERGALHLDDPVHAHLPHLLLPDDGGTPITLRHLLTHSSGLRDAGNEILGWLHAEGEPAPDQTELLQGVLPRLGPLLGVPGAQGRYTNVGYIVLAAVVEAVTGRRYQDHVTDHVLVPLGMSSTGFTYPAAPVSEAIGSHPVDLMTVPASFVVDLGRVTRERRRGRWWFHRVHPDQAAPSGLLGSPHDLGRLMLALLGGGRLDAVRVLSPESVCEMGRRHVEVVSSPAPGRGLGFGLSWFHEVDGAGRVRLTHGGQGLGFSSAMRLYPDEGLGVAVMANGTYLGKSFGLDVLDALGSLGWPAGSDRR